MLFSFAQAISTVVVALAGLAAAQDAGPGVITGCKPGTWALTFDDGPASFTPELLGYLRAANIKATFFVLGVQLADPKLAANTKAAFADGHLIASHTYDHKDLNAMTPEEIRSEMTKTEAMFKQVLGRTPNYMRPPFGNCNAACQQVMKQMNYSIFTWNVDSNDWRVVGTPDEPKAFTAFTTALATVKSTSTGYMSLQHDIHQFSVKMVPKIITAIKNAGLQFVTVDQCITTGVTPYRDGLPANGNSTTSATTPTQSSAATTAAASSSPAVPVVTVSAAQAADTVKSAAGHIATSGPAILAFAGLISAAVAMF